MNALNFPGQVHQDTGGGGIVLNLKTGQWHALNATAQVIWRQVSSTGDVEQAVRHLAEHHPEVSVDRLRADVDALRVQIEDRGLMFVPAACESRTSGGAAHPVVAVAAGGGSRWRVRLALGLALLVLRLPFAWAVKISRIARLPARGPAGPREAQKLLAAVQHVARRRPTRVACLETSLATVFAAALARRHLDWVLGVAEDPYRFHAWVEADEVPVIRESDHEFPDYRKVISL
jgi:hypothetical protein